MPSDALVRITPALAAETARIHPALEIVITTGFSSELLREFQRDNLDVLLFKMRAGQAPPLPAQPLGAEPLHWVACSEFHIDDLPVVPLATFHEGNVYRAAAIDSLNRINQRWKIACSTGELESIQSAISAGLGVSALPGSAVTGIQVVLDQRHGLPPLPWVQVAVAVREHAEDPLLDLVADLLIQAWRDQRPPCAFNDKVKAGRRNGVTAGAARLATHSWASRFVPKVLLSRTPDLLTSARQVSPRFLNMPARSPAGAQPGVNLGVILA